MPARTVDRADADGRPRPLRAPARSSGWPWRSAARGARRGWIRSAFRCCAACTRTAPSSPLRSRSPSSPASSLASRRRSTRAAAHFMPPLKDATRGSTEGRGRSRVRNALVVSEIAFACVLLVGAGLLIRSLVQVLDVDMGFDPAQAATIRVDPEARFATPEHRNCLLRRGSAPREGDSRRRGRRDHRRAAARTQPHVGHARQGCDLRTRPGPVGVRPRCQRRISAGHGDPAAARARHLARRHAVERAGDHDQRDDGADDVAGAGSDRQDHPRGLQSPNARDRRGRRRAPPRARAATRATRCICRCASAAISRQRTWSCGRRLRRRSSRSKCAPR